jgi:hypothetical protein
MVSQGLCCILRYLNITHGIYRDNFSVEEMLTSLAAGTHWIGCWVGPRAGLDHVEKIKFLTTPGLELGPLRRPARRQSLYRLRYPGSCCNGI